MSFERRLPVSIFKSVHFDSDLLHIARLAIVSDLLMDELLVEHIEVLEGSVGGERSWGGVVSILL